MGNRISACRAGGPWAESSRALITLAMGDKQGLGDSVPPELALATS